MGPQCRHKDGDNVSVGDADVYDDCVKNGVNHDVDCVNDATCSTATIWISTGAIWISTAAIWITAIDVWITATAVIPPGPTIPATTIQIVEFAVFPIWI